jgi:hypothetical protein
MELDELEIGDARAGQIREHDAVARRDRRIGRLAIDLPGAAGREQRRIRARLVQHARRVQEPHANHRGVLDDRLHGGGMVDDGDRRAAGEVRGEHARDLAARRIARVQHAPHRVRGLAREIERAVRLAIERRPPVDQLAHVARPLVDEDADGVVVAEAVAGGNRVGEVQRRRVVGADRRGDAALRVAGAAGAGIGFRQDEHAAVRRELDGRAQAGNAAADDEIVGGDACGHDRLLSYPG